MTTGQVDDMTESQRNKMNKPKFRNNLERLHYQYQCEKVSNLTDKKTQDRLLEENKRFDAVLAKTKPTIKLYNLLG